MSENDPTRQPSEEELRAAYEAELKHIRVDDVLIQTLVSLLNLGGRRAGLVPGTEDERDLGQLGQAIEGARALFGLVEAQLGPDAPSLRDALAQLQLAYARLSGTSAAGESGASAGPGADSGADPAPADPAPAAGPGGPAQSSGRLWVPGQ